MNKYDIPEAELKAFKDLLRRYRMNMEIATKCAETEDPFKADAEAAKNAIMETLSNYPALYNAWMHKNASCGVVDREVFTVVFSRAIERIRGRLEDQEWLQDLSEDPLYGKFVRTTLKLDVAAIRVALRNGELNDMDLRKMGIKLVPTANLTVERVPSVKETEEFLKEAEIKAAELESEA